VRLNRIVAWVALYLALLTLFTLGGPPSAPVQRATAQSGSSPATPPDEFERLKRPNAGVVHRNTITQTAATLSDLDVQYIGRTPRYKWCFITPSNPCTGVKLWPAAGETVTFEGRIANRGSAASGAFTYTWYIDGVQRAQASQPSMVAGAEAVVTLPWIWATGAHTVKLVLDTPGTITEVSESNNTRQAQTNALALGIYVEQAVYDYFNALESQSDWDNNPNTIDGNSFDDWMQRNVSIWNGMFAAAKFPLTPNGIIDRVRLDKIVRVANGQTRCNPNNPAARLLDPVNGNGIDYDIDLMWGFTSGAVGVASVCDPTPGRFYNLPGYQGLLDHDPGVLHELGHARYLPDLYGFNVNANKQTLATAVNGASTAILFTSLPSPSDWPQLATPSYIIMDGEIIYCTSRSGNSLTSCTRGTKRTTSRSHASGATIFADPIYLTNNQGSALIASTGMPFADASQYQFYLNAYAGRDNMDDLAVERFDEYSAYLWNRIAGKRPICGNWNPPCNINEYFQAIPQANIIQVKDINGAPIANALVSIYHAGRQCYIVSGEEECIDYGKVYDDPPLHALCTNAQGQIGLGTYPFGRAADGSHDILQRPDGWGSGTLAVKIVVGNRVGVAFLDVTAFNLAYWRGSTGQATYPITFAHWVTTSTTRSPACRFLPIIRREPQSASATGSAAGDASAAYPPPPTPAPYPAP
jgi:hypothetical protein